MGAGTDDPRRQFFSRKAIPAGHICRCSELVVVEATQDRLLVNVSISMGDD
jgi:hypothetical protein